MSPVDRWFKEDSAGNPPPAFIAAIIFFIACGGVFLVQLGQALIRHAGGA
jgi:hypothetical protein